MAQKTKPIEVPVTEPFRSAVLEVSVMVDGKVTTVGALMKEAQRAVTLANAALDNNGLVKFAAKELMKSYNRRGDPSIHIDATGDVYLRVGYHKRDRVLTGGAGLPSIESLRAEAKEMGLDVADLGRRKREIMERIKDAKAAKEPSPPEISQGSSPPDRLRDEITTGERLPHSVKIPR